MKNISGKTSSEKIIGKIINIFYNRNNEKQTVFLASMKENKNGARLKYKSLTIKVDKSIKFVKIKTNKFYKQN